MSSETVLLVDDDPSVRAYVSRALSIAGFTILEAVDGTDALQIAETAPGPIEILVTDINMPGIDGLELARRVQVLRPATGVVYMSGAPAHEVEAWSLLTGTVFLQKPFGPDVLVEHVRNALRRVQVRRERTTAVTPARTPVGRG